MASKKKKASKKIQISNYHPDNSQKGFSGKEMNIEHNNVQFQYYTFNHLQYRIDYPYTAEDCADLEHLEGGMSWLNIDGIIPEVIRTIGRQYRLDELQIDDILSEGQRAKLDDYGQSSYFLLLPMLHMNAERDMIEVEQISIVVHPKHIITIQQEHQRDPFNKLRNAIKQDYSLIRKKLQTDILLHQLLDAIVDEYFSVLDFIQSQLDNIELLITTNQTHREILSELSAIRKNILFIKRSIVPVKDIIDTLYTIDSSIISNEHRKYYKDLLDHIIIAIEYTDTYKELANNHRDTYMSIINARSNDVMKILTVVTTILAPFTVLSSIYGMNFDEIPLMHHRYGFFVLIGISLSITLIMLLYFKNKKWF